MRRIILAIRTFFVVLLNPAVAKQVAETLAKREATAPTTAQSAAAKAKPKSRPSAPSEALTLLATLQREARFVDFIQESLAEYSDAQIGAAVRDVHRDCREVLDRLFAMQPVMSEAEGSEVDVPAGFDPGRFRLTGNVVGEPPFRGQLVHGGWEATRCELPTWSGSAAAGRIVAPVEVELE